MIGLWKILQKDYFTTSKKTFYEKDRFIKHFIIFMNVTYYTLTENGKY